MGWTDTVKKFFSRDTTGKVTELARGSSGESSMPNMVPNTPDSGMGGAYQQLATMLSVDADLMLRYADYENMDDYGEISCLAGSSLIFTLEDGWVAIRDLAERGGGFWVLSYDREMRSLVPAWATGARCTGDAGHGKPMVRVVIDDGRVITCTADHLFLTKHGEWVRAGDLGVGDRLMPGALRMRSLNVDATAPYWQVHQPHSDSALRSSNGMRWMFLHRLVAECGVDLPEGAVVHHVNGDSLNNDPKNLSVEDISSHAHHHIAGIDNSRYFPDWTPERRAEMAKRMCGNTYRRGTTCSAETRERMSAARRGQHKDVRWRERIGIAQPNRIDIPEDRLEAALREGGNVAEAARILGVSWSKAKRAAVKADLLDVAANHRVLRVERVEDRPAVYDIEVPKIHNFVCDGVVVHNSALDIYADDATVIDTVHNKVIWGTSKDKIIRDIIDDLLHRRIRIEEDIWSAIRTLSKYGNLYCLPGGTRVWTDQGPRAIETIEAGTMVQGYKAGKKVFLPVARRLDNGVREIFRVRTRHREFLATADHPVLVDCGNGVTEWVQVGNLRVVRYEPSSDRKTGGINYAKTHKLVIATSCHEAAEAPLCRDLFVADVHPKEREIGGNVFNDFCAPERMDPWLCRLLGFMYGDGGLATERMDVSNSTVWLCRKVYEDRNEYYEGLLRRLHLEPNPNDDGSMTLVHSVLFKCFLLSLGWKNGSGKKRLPLWLGRLPREHRLAFLDGFMDADGWTTDPPTWTESAYHFEINNIELARDLKCLIDGLGFRSGNLRFRTREAPIINGKQVQSVQESAMLTFSRHEFGGDFVSETLLEVEPAGQAQVYDLEIADDAHNFVAEGVVVHNCEIVMNETGVLGLNWLPPPTMRRIIDARGNLVGFVQDPSAMFSFNIATREDLEKLRVKRDGSSAVFFYPWEVVHWRLRGKQMRALYGYSLLDSARWVWKRLLMLEDSSLVCKLTKSPARFAFYVDTGEMPPREARAMVDDVRRRYKKKRILDPATGKLDLRMNPVAQDEDFFIPTRAGKDASRIEVLAGPDYDDTNVLQYFQKKLYAAIRIPPQYLGGTEVTNRASLTQEDVQFARLEMRIQREFVTGLSHVVRVHLAALNIDPDSIKWDLRMPTPSSIFEMQQIEVWNARVALAAGLRDFFTMPWIIANIFHMSDEDALFASEAKKNEDDANAMGQAQVQADIMQKFPELSQMPIPVGEVEGGQPQAESHVDVRREIRQALSESSSSNNEVLRLLHRMEPAISRVERRVRAVKTGS
jgi:intein/homing endonuclease